MAAPPCDVDYMRRAAPGAVAGCARIARFTRRCGGSAWESNPASPLSRRANGFEDREGHRAPFASSASLQERRPRRKAIAAGTRHTGSGGMKHVIVGTAGHIDHGKSSLVLALTGTDPDRLQEEKARGITIDLGFAHTVEDGIALSFVDVPGHERFVTEHAGGRRRHGSRHAACGGGRIGDAADPRALRHLPAAGGAVRPRRHHEIGPGRCGDDRRRAAGGAGTRCRILPGESADSSPSRRGQEPALPICAAPWPRWRARPMRGRPQDPRGCRSTASSP